MMSKRVVRAEATQGRNLKQLERKIERNARFLEQIGTDITETRNLIAEAKQKLEELGEERLQVLIELEKMKILKEATEGAI